MALIKTPVDYNRTGHNGLTHWSNRLSYIPIVGGLLSVPLGWLGAGVDSLKWLFKGKVGSAATALTAGAVATTVNGAAGAVGYNILSGVTTGKTLGTHMRKGTEAIIGGGLGVVGAKPTVLKSYTAGPGYIGGGSPAQTPGRFATQISQQRGQDPNAAYANYMRGEGGVHVNELGSATGRGM